MLSYIVEYFTLILGNEYFAYHPPPPPLYTHTILTLRIFVPQNLNMI